MNLWSCVSLGLKEIGANKFRSFLTMLGIILGVSSLVAMSALVKGMEKGAKEALIAIGGLQKIRIEPSDLPVEQQHLADQAMGITLQDVYALQHSAPLVTAISPEMRIDRPLVSVGDRRFRPFLCAGVWPVALDMSEHVVEHGRMFNAIDEEEARSVCVIGTAVRDELFGSPEELGYEVNPVGKTLLINRQPFTVIGMFRHYESEQQRNERLLAAGRPKSTGSGPSRNRGWRGGGRGGNFVFWIKNATIYMPMTTAWIKFRASSGMSPRGGGVPSAATANIPDPRLSTLEVRVADIDRMDVALQQMRNVLLTTHRGIEDFGFRTQEEWAENIQTFIRNARMSGGMIAGISLLVGGIGIMNIMLASISSRIREIGIRKSIGATTQDIFLQVLIESVVLAVLGGLVGLLTSYGLVRMIGQLSPTENAPIITATALGLAFGASVAVGILAGIIPAVKASGLHPIQALRYE